MSPKGDDRRPPHSIQMFQGLHMEDQNISQYIVLLGVKATSVDGGVLTVDAVCKATP